MRAAEDGGRRTSREEAVTAGVGAAKANGRRARRRGTAAGAADDTAAASGKPTFFFICISSHLRPCGDGWRPILNRDVDPCRPRPANWDDDPGSRIAASTPNSVTMVCSSICMS